MIYTNDHWRVLQLSVLGRVSKPQLTECVHWQDVLAGLAMVAVIAASFTGILYLLTNWV